MQLHHFLCCLHSDFFSEKCMLCIISRFLTAVLYLAIDAPGGFLFEWWSVFWDIFIARTNEKHSEPAAAYIEVCISSGALFSFTMNLHLRM